MGGCALKYCHLVVMKILLNLMNSSVDQGGNFPCRSRRNFPRVNSRLSVDIRTLQGDRGTCLPTTPHTPTPATSSAPRRTLDLFLFPWSPRERLAPCARVRKQKTRNWQTHRAVQYSSYKESLFLWLQSASSSTDVNLPLQVPFSPLKNEDNFYLPSLVFETIKGDDMCKIALSMTCITKCHTNRIFKER